MRYDNRLTILQIAYSITVGTFGGVGFVIGSNFDKQNPFKNGLIGCYIGIGIGLIAPISIPLLVLGGGDKLIDIVNKYRSDN